MLDEFLITELSVDLDWIAGVHDVGVHAGLVKESCEREQPGGLELTVANLDRQHLHQLEELSKKFLCRCANVKRKCHHNLDSMLAINVALADQIEEEFDVGVGASNRDSVEKNVVTESLFNGRSEITKL